MLDRPTDAPPGWQVSRVSAEGSDGRYAATVVLYPADRDGPGHPVQGSNMRAPDADAHGFHPTFQAAIDAALADAWQLVGGHSPEGDQDA